VALRLTHFDRVFIPINCAQKHWFSVAIDYERKKIEIFDSLNAVYTDNFTKPIQEQKNATLMLVGYFVISTFISCNMGEYRF
jgi:Ulp1 family protease